MRCPSCGSDEITDPPVRPAESWLMLGFRECGKCRYSGRMEEFKDAESRYRLTRKAIDDSLKEWTR